MSITSALGLNAALATDGTGGFLQIMMSMMSRYRNESGNHGELSREKLEGLESAFGHGYQG